MVRRVAPFALPARKCPTSLRRAACMHKAFEKALHRSDGQRSSKLCEVPSCDSEALSLAGTVLSF